MHGKPTYAKVAHRSNVFHVETCRIGDADVQRLSRCLLAEVKDCDIINDICLLLRDADFSQVKPKYLGGLR